MIWASINFPDQSWSYRIATRKFTPHFIVRLLDIEVAKDVCLAYARENRGVATMLDPCLEMAFPGSEFPVVVGLMETHP